MKTNPTLQALISLVFIASFISVSALGAVKKKTPPKKSQTASASQHATRAPATRQVSRAASTKKPAAKVQATQAAVAQAAPAAKAPTAKDARRPASVSSESMMANGATSEKVLKVSGQTRNLSMMLTLKGEKDKIKFGDIRENFKDEIPKTNY